MKKKPTFESIEQLKDFLVDLGYEETIVLENPDFLEAVLGTDTDGRLVYDYDLMVESLANEDNMSDEDAIEFIEYNTVRSLPYMGPMAPIIMHDARRYL